MIDRKFLPLLGLGPGMPAVIRNPHPHASTGQLNQRRQRDSVAATAQPAAHSPAGTFEHLRPPAVSTNRHEGNTNTNATREARALACQIVDVNNRRLGLTPDTEAKPSTAMTPIVQQFLAAAKRAGVA